MSTRIARQDSIVTNTNSVAIRSPATTVHHDSCEIASTISDHCDATAHTAPARAIATNTNFATGELSAANTLANAPFAPL